MRNMIRPLSPASLPASLQALPPAQARFCLNTLRFIEKDLVVSLAGSRVLVGFSGGADSTALLLCLHCLAPKCNFTVLAAHLDHKLRPSSGKESALCGAFCDGLGIEYIMEGHDIAALSGTSKRGIEDAAREERYVFFAKTARERNCDWIVTGHNANDLAEDILMRLIRGTGWPGLSGMVALDENRKLLRPLLLTPRVDIEAFLDALKLGWIEDESNSDAGYFRNRVRNVILPMFLEENPSFLEQASGLWKLGRIDAAWFNTILSGEFVQLFQQKPHEETGTITAFLMPRERLTSLPKALRLRAYKKALAMLGPGQARLDTLLALDASMETGGEKTIHQFPGGKLALVDKQGIHWRPGIE